MITCTACGAAATDSTHKGEPVKKCPNCETIKFRQLEVTNS